MNHDRIQSILAEYDKQCSSYEAFTITMQKLVSELLAVHELHVQSINCRTKSRSSLESKLNQPESRHQRLADVTDISGVRIITYFQDDVDDAAGIIASEFGIDFRNSVDKQSLLKPDQFGYQSLQYIASLSATRAKLSEYQQFRHMKLEIQVRSILQHAWAEIEHDRGYKVEREIPTAVRRRFSRLAALLEVADTEFAAIRDDIDQYHAEVQRQFDARHPPSTIDRTSLDIFYRQDSDAINLDKHLAAIAGASVLDGISHTHIITKSVDVFGIGTIEELGQALIQNREVLIGYQTVAQHRGFYGDVRAVAHGYSGLILCYVLAAKSGSVEQAERWLTLVGIGADSDRPITARAMIAMYRQAVQSRDAGAGDRP